MDGQADIRKGRILKLLVHPERLVKIHKNPADIRKSKRVLKLVHPGRFSEIHKKPITAAEVLERNPRHCITRPDVFRFPWIVVHPESVLMPGNVFYIVPYHTLHRLLQRNMSQDESPPLRQPLQSDFHFPPRSYKQEFYGGNNVNDGFVVHEEGDLPETCVKTKHFHRKPLKKQCPNHISEPRLEADNCCKYEDLREGSLFPKNPVGKDQQDHHHSNSNHDFRETRSLANEMCWDGQPAGRFQKDDCRLELRGSEKDKKLKSCLKKKNCAPRARSLRVRFTLPGEDAMNVRVDIFEFEQVE